MCGIVGFLHHDYSNKEAVALLQKLMNAISHRGPDQDGVELGEDFAFGHHRLSIIDLSDSGRQPFKSDDDRFVLTYNGEIYNYIELRAELEALGHDFRTKTDTEVLLKSWIEWGEACLERFIGMFAFAILDRQKKDVWLARDAFGIKPLFYTANRDFFAFSSELPALIKGFAEKKHFDVNWQTAYRYIQFGEYDTGEDTFVNDIKTLKSGHIIKINLENWLACEQQPWWQAEIRPQTKLTRAQLAKEARALFLRNIKLHLRSDTKVALSLSGGLDSSALAYGMRHVAPDITIHSFSYIADDETLSEESWIDRVNADIGAVPNKVYFDDENLLEGLNACIEAQGEPMGSTSVFAQYLISRDLHAKGFKVVLEGQGADEIFGGYQGYPGQRIRSFVDSCYFLKAIAFAKAWSKWPNRKILTAYKLYLAEILPDWIYDFARSIATNAAPKSWYSKSFASERNLTLKRHRQNDKFVKHPQKRRLVAQLCYQISEHGLPHLLRHSDRNTMAYSIESRVPFLTPDLAEFMMSLPEDELVSDKGETKSLMRAMLQGIVPDDIINRRDKIGFETPENKMAIILKPLINKLYEDNKARAPLFDVQFMQKIFHPNLDSKDLSSDFVWRVYNFLYWHSWFKSGMNRASPYPNSIAATPLQRQHQLDDPAPNER